MSQAKVGAAQGNEGAEEASTLWKSSTTYLSAVGLLVLGYFPALIVHQVWFRDKKPFIIASGVSIFALLFVLSLAIERIVQPFSGGLGPDTATAKKALADEKNGKNQTEALAKKRQVVEDCRDQTALVTWGLASGLGFLLSSILNVTMLGTILAAGPKPWYWADLLITGFVIGAGTKPLNDLVTRLQDKGVKT
jgi:FtsH-binding integral membrane protein